MSIKKVSSKKISKKVPAKASSKKVFFDEVVIVACTNGYTVTLSGEDSNGRYVSKKSIFVATDPVLDFLADNLRDLRDNANR